MLRSHHAGARHRRRQGAFAVVLLSAPFVLVPAPVRAQDTARAPVVADSLIPRVASPDEAVAAALGRSPAIAAADARVAAARGSLTQAGLRPNPVAGALTENVGGTGPYRGFRSAQTTVDLSQRLEIGGQRAARVGVAQTDVTLAERALAAVRLDLVRDVRQAYAEAVATRGAARIAAEGVRLAQEVLRVAQVRVGAGNEPELQQQRAAVALSTAAMIRERADREAEVARRALAVLLAARDVALAASDRWFNDIGRNPAGRVPTDPAANPDFARWRDEMARAEAAAGLERRRAVPDLTVGAGFRRFEDGSDSAAVLSLSVPLPFFDRNQGNIARADAERTRVERLAELNRLALGTSLVDAGQRLETAWRDADSLRRVIVPGAEQAFRVAREGYASGRFSFLEVLDAQRTLLEARAQLNMALRDFHARRAEVERLSGGPIPPEGAAGAGGRR